MEYNYKIGDKVRVKADLTIGKRYGAVSYFTPDMDEYRGEIVTIDRLDNRCGIYKIKEDNGKWSWTDEMLEPVNTGYKVGDRVRVKSDLSIGEIYGIDSFVSGMGKYRGEIVTISKVIPSGSSSSSKEYKIEEDNETWFWTDEMLKPLSNEEKKSMKYKVGDRVRIRKDLIEGEKYGVDDFIDEMNEYRGKIVTIDNVLYNKKKYLIKEDNHDWYWTGEMLEPIKYEVGDKVRVREDLIESKKYGDVSFIDQMEKYRGRIVTISKVVYDGLGIYDKYKYIIEEDDNTWEWSSAMFDLVESRKAVKNKMENMDLNVTVNGNTVTVTDNTFVGVAKCSPEDDFDLNFGFQLAFDRMKMKKESAPWVPEIGEDYYIPDFVFVGRHKDHVRRTFWSGDSADRGYYTNRMICKTEEQAKILYDTMVACAQKFQELGADKAAATRIIEEIQELKKED